MECNLPTAEALFSRLPALKFVVIGDVMLDSYYYGSVARISPEAPVPVNKISSISSRPGGAGNVAANLARLGAHTHICSMIGQDDNGQKLTELFEAFHINVSGLFSSPERQTTTKLRVVGAGQQMLRLDFERERSLTAREETFILNWLDEEALDGAAGVIISDYAKGICTPSFCREIIKRAAARRIPALVDPKGADWDKYRGADFITPNIKELGEAAQRSLTNETTLVEAAAQEVMNRYRPRSILATRSEKGLTFVSAEESFTISAAAREVYDVSGAGDTVAAVFLSAVAGGLTVRQAAFLANEAAGIVVGRHGAYAINKEELLEVLSGKGRRAPGLISRREAHGLVKNWRAAGEKIAFTNGCFDILHTGHISYLEKAAQLGDKLLVGLNSDDSVRRLKGESRPLVGEADRAKILAALACVDAVVIFAEDTPRELLSELRPDVLVKGGDYRPEDVAGREYAGKVEIIEFAEGYSTTGLLRKIAGLVREGKI